MAQQILLRRGTAAEWTAANPILAEGEMALEKDTKKYKIGNGITNWNGLEYSSLPSDVYTKDQVVDEFATKADHGYTVNETPKTLKQIEALIGNITAGNGEQVQLQATATYIQWKYESEQTWRNLIAISAITGTEGRSAYQVWLLQPGNYGKTVEDFMTWIQQPSTEAASDANYAALYATDKADLAYSAALAAAGDYQTWVQEPENVGKTVEDYLLWIRETIGPAESAVSLFPTTGKKIISNRRQPIRCFRNNDICTKAGRMGNPCSKSIKIGQRLQDYSSRWGNSKGS